MPQPIRRVALMYDATKAYDLGVMAGVAAYLHASTRWSLYVEESALKDQRLPNLERWQGSGIIANLDDTWVYAAVAKSKLPAVGFGSGYGSYSPKSRIPYFLTDNETIARIAADHLWKRGSRNFAFCGYSHTPINGWAKEREIAFRARLAERNCSVSTYSDPPGRQLP